MNIAALDLREVSRRAMQRPFDMGYKVMYALKYMKDGKAPPPDPTHTGLDICTPKNVDACIGGAKSLTEKALRTGGRPGAGLFLPSQ